MPVIQWKMKSFMINYFYLGKVKESPSPSVVVAFLLIHYLSNFIPNKKYF